jgi:hypothetical protein
MEFGGRTRRPDADVSRGANVFSPESPIILENTLNVWVISSTAVGAESEIITGVIDDTPVPGAIV